MTEKIVLPYVGDLEAHLSLLKEASGQLGLRGQFIPRMAAPGSPGLIVALGEASPDWLCDHIVVNDAESALAALRANAYGEDSPLVNGIADQLTSIMGRFVTELEPVKIKQKVSFTHLIVDGDEDRRRERQDRERKERFGDDA